MKKFHVVIELIEPMLGTVAKDPEVWTTFVQTKATQAVPVGAGKQLVEMADELETLPAQDDTRGYTGFHMLNGKPIIYDYMLKGNFKTACGMLRRSTDWKSSKVTSYKTVIDGSFFIEPRRISLQLPDGSKLGTLERPLRAETMQGPRVTLAKSDTAPAGTRLDFTVTCLLDKINGIPVDELLQEWLNYGQYQGLGQWRSGRWGSYKVIDFKEV